MDTYDKSTKLKIAYEDLEQAKFFVTLLNKIAVRIGAEYENPVNTKSVDVINDYDITKAEITQNAEIIIELPERTKLVIIKTRKIGRLRIATKAGETQDDGEYLTVGKGGEFVLSGSRLLNIKNLYCKCTTSDNIIEILTAI
jgi:hypothetical protein